MKDFTDIESWSPKKIRTLRNNLNNRIESFTSQRIQPKELQKSHMLHGMELEDCSVLLEVVKKIIKQSKQTRDD